MSTLRNMLRKMPNHKKIKRQIINFTVFIIVFEIITFLMFLLNMVYTIKQYEYETGNIMMALPFEDFIVKLRLFGLVIIIGFTILPVVLFYQYFIGSKSIYTMLRLPGKYSRLQFYCAQVKISIKGLMGFWFIQLLIIIVFYFIYILIIPKESIPPGVWDSLWKSADIYKIYPFTKPMYFLPVIFTPFLLSNLSILVGLIERTRTRSLLAIFAAIISGIGLYSYKTNFAHSVWIVPLVTVLSVSTSVYYIYRIEIV